MDDMHNAKVTNKEYSDLTPEYTLGFTEGTTNCVPRVTFGCGTRTVPNSLRDNDHMLSSLYSTFQESIREDQLVPIHIVCYWDEAYSF